MSIRRWWRRFDSIEVEREELINFILSEAGISQKANCFSEVKMLLKLKYDNYKQNLNLLEEEYLSIKYRKEALETSSLENIPIATLS